MFVDYIAADTQCATADDWAEYKQWLGENDGRDDFDELHFEDIGDYIDDPYCGEGDWRGDMESHAHLTEICEEDIPF